MALEFAQLWEAVAQRELGALTLAPGRDAALPGRNSNQVVHTENGSYFVKVLGHGDQERRVRNSLAYDLFTDANPGTDLPQSPRCLVAEPEHGLLIFEHVPAAESGAALMVEERFHAADAERLGAQVATLHLTSTRHTPGPVPSWPSPNPGTLDGLPLRALPGLTGGELKAYGLLQGDEAVVRGLRKLAGDCADAEPTPVHGDLRVDQLLFDEGIWVIDWEEFGTADAARDTGTFLGEWIYRTVLDIPTARGDGVALPAEVAAPDIVARGYAKLQRLRPIAMAFWQGYRNRRPVDDAFVDRTARLIGWHLLDRFVAGSTMTSTLPAIHRAAAGVGRAALLNPEGVIELLGLQEAS